MFKRVIWMGIGAAAGSVGTVWAERKVKTKIDQVAQKVTVQNAAAVARDRMGDVRDTVAAAVSEGRATKQSAETEMRRNVADRFGGSRGPTRRAGT